MTFHRLTDIVPGDYVRSGFSGTIPDATVNWLNNPPGDPTQAPAAGAINNSANPYFGSFFVGGKEDAVDNYANRAPCALGTDIDDIDSSIRRGVATLSSATWAAATPASATRTFSPPLNIYVGSGTPTPAQYLELVDSILHASLVTAGGASKIVPTSWTIGTVDAAGFVNLSSVTFNDALPPGTQCTLFYGAKTAVAELPRDALLSYLHSIPEISIVVQQLLMTLHAPIGSALAEAWNATWDSTVAELSRSGLNERYKCANYCEATNPAGANADLLTIQALDAGWPAQSANQYGSGAWIYRRGMAPTSISYRQTAAPLETDKLNACWRAVLADTAATNGGSVGFAIQGSRNTYSGTAEKGPGYAAQLYHHPVRMAVADWGAGDACTVIPEGAAASVQYTDGELVCSLTDEAVQTWFFKTISGANYTGINTGVDMLEVVDQGVAKFWLIHRITDARTCVLRAMSGAVAPISRALGGYPAPATVTNVTVTWHSTAHSISDGAAESRLQLNVQGSTYDPGYLEQPSPMNYGASFYPGLPNVGLQSNYGNGQLQHFDVGVVSIYGNVPGNPLVQPPVKSGTAFPTPEPDVALFIGVKSPLVDSFGQTPNVAYAMISSMGMAYFPKVFTAAIGCYDPLLSSTMRVESDIWLDTVDTANTIYGTEGLTLLSDHDTQNAALSFQLNTASIALSNPGHAGERIPILTDSNTLGLYCAKELGSDNQRWRPLGMVSAAVVDGGVTVALDPRSFSEVRFTSWTAANPAIAATIQLTPAALITASVSTDDQAKGLAGRTYRVAVAMDPSILVADPEYHVSFDFEVDNSNVTLETAGPYDLLGKASIVDPYNHYALFEITVFGNSADGKSYVNVRQLFLHQHFLW